MKKIQKPHKTYCWYCGKPIENQISYHHFFNYNDIKFRLYRIFKEPSNDEEHKNMQRMIKIIQKNLPQFPLHPDCHKEIEGKIV